MGDDKLDPIDGYTPLKEGNVLASAMTTIERAGMAAFNNRPKPMSEADKAQILCATRKEYLRTHSGTPAQVEVDAWVAVYRKAASLVNA